MNKLTITLLSFGCCFMANVLLAHDSVPGAPQTQPIALVGGKVFPVSGAPIDGATVLFDKGKIVAVGKEVALPEKCLKVNVTGKHIYPGLIDAHSSLGLIEVPSVRGTVDESETGLINPNVEAIKAVHPDSELIPVTRSGGVLLTMTVPDGGLLAGRASVIQLDGWTWEDMALKTDVAMQVVWPQEVVMRNANNLTAAKRQIEERDSLLKTLRDAVEDAAAYKTARDATPAESFAQDQRWEAMLPLITGKQPLLVSANELQQLQGALAFAAQHKLKLIVHGGYDAERCAAALKKQEVPVIIEGTYRLPLRVDDDYDAPFTLPARLQAAGVKYCISGGGKHAVENTRNLPYHAAMAVAFGLKPEEALRAITLSPAEILGIADRVGSLDVGKDATLIVTDGDVLDTPSHVERAWIGGRAVDLNDRQKRLWKKYQQKYEQPKP